MDAKKTKPKAKKKEAKILVCMDWELGQRLKLERVHTGIPVNRIIANLVRQHFESRFRMAE